MSNSLSLAQQLVLLAVEEQSHKLKISSTRLEYGVWGAALGELLLGARIMLDGDRVLLTDSGPFDEPLLDRSLALIAGDSKQRTLRDWVSRTHSKLKRGKEEVFASLEQRGVVRVESRAILRFFRQTRYLLLRPEERGAVEQQVRQAVLGMGMPDQRGLTLLALMEATGLTRKVLSGEDLEAAKSRLRDWTRKDPLRKAVASVIQAAESGDSTVVITS